jgi:hypothetical protein
VALVEGQETKPPTGSHQVYRVINRFGNPEPFFAKGSAFSEGAYSAWHQAQKARAFTSGRLA